MIEKTADSLLLSKHSIQFSALFLLLSAAQTYDSQFATHTSTKGPRRSVYDHDLSINENIPCNIDSDVSLLQANQTFID